MGIWEREVRISQNVMWGYYFSISCRGLKVFRLIALMQTRKNNLNKLEVCGKNKHR
jgi:hypothetical protein